MVGVRNVSSSGGGDLDEMLPESDKRILRFCGFYVPYLRRRDRCELVHQTWLVCDKEASVNCDMKVKEMCSYLDAKLVTEVQRSFDLRNNGLRENEDEGFVERNAVLCVQCSFVAWRERLRDQRNSGSHLPLMRKTTAFFLPRV